MIADMDRLRLTPRRGLAAIAGPVGQPGARSAGAVPDVPAEHRPARLAAARAAIRQLRRAASTPFLRAHY